MIQSTMDCSWLAAIRSGKEETPSFRRIREPANLFASRRASFIRELQDAAQKKFQESLVTCQNAKQELIRLQAEQLTAQRKRPRSANSS